MSPQLDVDTFLHTHVTVGNPYRKGTITDTKKLKTTEQQQFVYHMVVKAMRAISPSKAAPSTPTFLDRLQKDAQNSELDYTNTSPRTFLFLTVMQLVVTQLIGWLISPHWQYLAYLCLGSHFLGWILSTCIKSNKYYDIIEDVSYFSIILYNYLTIQKPSTRAFLVHMCALLWCLRLCAFVGYRILVRGSDWRFDKLIKAHSYNLFGWVSGGTWCFFNGFCLWVLAGSPPNTNPNLTSFPSLRGSTSEMPLNSLDGIGFFIWLFGLAIETISDVQKYNFNAAYPSGANKNWIKEGLWAYSRHPNYAGEITLWFGLSLITLGGTMDLSPRLALCMMTPLWSLFFLVFTSLMLLEKRADAKWAGRPEYEAYKARVPVLFPGV